MSKMFVKCETKSSRVKGLAFHPSLQWVLAALHNGTIQLWDYRIGSLIDKFEEHEGPVRGIDFHSSQPLFVSGGDDYKVKLWSLTTRKCIFTFLGHLDYLRTVFFHHIYPWILSASDDQTVRIWNWQSRACIAVLTGHNHYVMSALFHPYEDLVVSASLDQTIRVWDTSGLREKTGGAGGAHAFGKGSFPGGPGGRHHASEMFTANDAVCKFVLEGHERGVNWAAFHPSMPLIASAADDRMIKLWRYNDSKAWEVDTLRGHFNNVSCLVFHPQRELLISNSEDRTIRVWDVSKRVGVHTFRRENDRFWIIAAHRTSSALAVGHDSGMVVFKLHTERPPSALHSRFHFYYIRDRVVCFRDLQLTLQLSHKHGDARNAPGSLGGGNAAGLAAAAEVSICEVRRPANAMTAGPKYLLVNSLNATDLNAIVIYADAESGFSYDLVVGPLPQAGLPYPGSPETHTGSCHSVAFVARNRFAMIDKAGATSLGVYNMNNELCKKVELPCPVDRLFFGGNNRLILKSEDKLRLFEVPTCRVYPEVQCGGGGGIRSVLLSPTGEYLMVISKHSLMLLHHVGHADGGASDATGGFEVVCAVHENIRIKGGAWDEDNGTFVYSTLSHVKYLLLNGDRGIIHCLNEPVYIFKVQRGMYYYLDRRAGVHVEPLNCQEYLFKLALHRRQFDQVALFVRNGQLCGNALIAYLKKKGYPEVALEFLTDKKARFHLALESAWQLLGRAALQQGYPSLVESAYQKLKEFEKLSFLYFITGNIGKLRKMLRIAELRKDPMSEFHNALLLGDAEERVQVLAEVGQIALAALTAKTYGLTALYEQLHDSVKDMSLDTFMPAVPQLLMPPIPILRCTEAETSAWPSAVSEGASVFDKAMQATAGMKPEAAGARLYKDMVEGASAGATAGAPPAWEDAAEDLDGFEVDLGEGVAGGDWSDGIDLPPDDAGLSQLGGLDEPAPGKETLEHGFDGAGSSFVAKREPPHAAWLKGGQPVVADFVAAGEFSLALETLQRRMALRNPAPLLPIFSRVYQAAWASLPGLPFAPSLPLALSDRAAGKGAAGDGGLKPHRLILPSSLMEDLREAHKLVTAGRFQEALSAFRFVLHSVPLVVANNAEEEQQVHEFIEIARHYVTGMILEMARLSLGESDPGRNVELVAYFACCKMQASHLFLVLRRAMSVAWKAQNFVTTAAVRKCIRARKAYVSSPGVARRLQSRLGIQGSIWALQHEFETRVDRKSRGEG
ncbi:AT3G15980 protein, related [Neospora caninum Liverpool]|uniref:AT3G15980 protein, related n=1 Tax=Neospora caninum (strain Liverpool) TaxID=572307 RepID=F0VDV0_NEOCL|nr:AT3G15980 protein, related [Neospora caninum Liverpool]CBZ51893.1 AT3G15980 protein, related [Neospora caninum Liverpool]|eukprot:XP_003881926.1 AT3G15980 protein, related [Neospora caninum Liverpool]